MILTTFGRPGYLRRAMEAGVSGFVVKDAPGRAAGRRGAAGARAASGSSTPHWRPPRWPAARRRSPGDERDVLVAARATAPRSRRSRPRLFLSEGTVRNHLSSAISKTGCRNRMEAVLVAEDRGWL